MSNVKLLPFQKEVLEKTKGRNRVAYYLDMGLGKTFVGSEKMIQLAATVNLVVCQKSKIKDWYEHFASHYTTGEIDFCTRNLIFDLTNKNRYEKFLHTCKDASEGEDNLFPHMIIGIINYELIFRRPELKTLRDFTLMLDESSLIANENSKRSRFILSLNPANVILLSGTPTSGKYERLWSQCRLLGWNITKTKFWDSYICWHLQSFGGGPRFRVVDGYQNTDQLRMNLRDHGAVFLKTSSVIDLPEQVEQKVMISPTKDYKKFLKDRYLEIDGGELIGDCALTYTLFARQLCGQYHPGKLQALEDLCESTEDRLIIFYCYTAELNAMKNALSPLGRPFSVVNGRENDLNAYEKVQNSITFVQYQAGAMGLNLQKANRIIYFSLPLGRGSCDLWEQSKKRIHRIGQKNTCFYYYLLVRDSVETKNLESLQRGVDYTNELFMEEQSGGRKEF